MGPLELVNDNKFALKRTVPSTNDLSLLTINGGISMKRMSKAGKALIGECSVYCGPMFADGWTPQSKSFIDTIFLHLFPIQLLLMSVIVEATCNMLLVSINIALMSCYM